MQGQEGGWDCASVLKDHQAEVVGITLHPSRKYFVTGACAWRRHVGMMGYAGVGEFGGVYGTCMCPAALLLRTAHHEVMRVSACRQYGVSVRGAKGA